MKSKFRANLAFVGMRNQLSSTLPRWFQKSFVDIQPNIVHIGSTPLVRLTHVRAIHPPASTSVLCPDSSQNVQHASYSHVFVSSLCPRPVAPCSLLLKSPLLLLFTVRYHHLFFQSISSESTLESIIGRRLSPIFVEDYVRN